MLKAHELQAQGLTQKQIAAAIGKSERTVRNYLKQMPRARRKQERKSVLDEYKPAIEILVRENPDINGARIYEKLLKAGFRGKSSIVREYITKIRKEERQKAVIRFETLPAFGGVTEEILYDNMKTAWYYDGEKWQTNKDLARFAYHYGFVPRRCRIHRPETKGKVERFNQYFEGNFFADYKNRCLNISQLNEDAVRWINRISSNKLVQFNQSRNERFALEKESLKPLPSENPDIRKCIPLIVNRESCITYRTNRYSVPPVFIGKTVIAKPSVEKPELELFDKDGHSIRIIQLEEDGKRVRVMTKKDMEMIHAVWIKGVTQDSFKRQPRKTFRITNPDYVAARNPVFYEQFLSGGR